MHADLFSCVCSGLDDPITCILASLRPGNIRPVLAAMSQHVPRTLEALLLHALPPAAAELLTQKLEQADAAAAETTGNPLNSSGQHCSCPAALLTNEYLHWSTFRTSIMSIAAVQRAKATVPLCWERLLSTPAAQHVPTSL